MNGATPNAESADLLSKLVGESVEQMLMGVLLLKDVAVSEDCLILLANNFCKQSTQPTPMLGVCLSKLLVSIRFLNLTERSAIALVYAALEAFSTESLRVQGMEVACEVFSQCATSAVMDAMLCSTLKSNDTFTVGGIVIHIWCAMVLKIVHTRHCRVEFITNFFIKHNMIKCLMEDALRVLHFPEFIAAELLVRTSFAALSNNDKTLMDMAAIFLANCSSESCEDALEQVSMYYATATFSDVTLIHAQKYFANEFNVSIEESTFATRMAAPDRSACVASLRSLFPQRKLSAQTRPITEWILQLMQSSDASIRSKAVKVVAQAISGNISLGYDALVEEAVMLRISDTAACVRDGALEALSKWLPSVALKSKTESTECLFGCTGNMVSPQGIHCKYFTLLLDRVLDKATSVRKRAIRMLASLCASVPEFEYKLAFSLKLFRRLLDEEETVSLLAKRILTELLFCFESDAELASKAVLFTTFVHQIDDFDYIDTVPLNLIEPIFTCIHKCLQQSYLLTQVEWLHSLNILVAAHPNLLSPQVFCLLTSLLSSSCLETQYYCLVCLNNGLDGPIVVQFADLNHLELIVCDVVQKGPVYVLPSAVSLLVLIVKRTNSRHILDVLNQTCRQLLKNPDIPSAQAKRLVTILGNLEFCDDEAFDLIFENCNGSVKSCAVNALGSFCMKAKNYFFKAVNLFIDIFEKGENVLCVLQIILIFIKREEKLPRTDGIAEFMAQKFIDYIVKYALLGIHVNVCQEIIGIVAIKGLAHPKLVMPAIIALECGSGKSCQVARYQHYKMHSLRHSVIYDNLKESLLAAFEYSAQDLQSVYNVFKTKKERHHFLSTLTKLFESCNVELLKWTSKCICILEKSEEDSLFVVKMLDNYASDEKDVKILLKKEEFTTELHLNALRVGLAVYSRAFISSKSINYNVVIENTKSSIIKLFKSALYLERKIQSPRKRRCSFDGAIKKRK